MQQTIFHTGMNFSKVNILLTVTAICYKEVPHTVTLDKTYNIHLLASKQFMLTESRSNTVFKCIAFWFWKCKVIRIDIVISLKVQYMAMPRI